MLLILPIHDPLTGMPRSREDRACVAFEASTNELAGWLYALTKVQELSDELGRDVSIGLEDWALPALLQPPQAVPFGRPLVVQGAPPIETHACPSCDLDISPGSLQLLFTLPEERATRYSVRVSCRAIHAYYTQALALEQR